MPRIVAEPIVAGASGLIAPYILVPLWGVVFALVYVPLVAYLRPSNPSIDLAGLVDGVGGAVLGVLAGLLLSVALRATSWRSWAAFGSCFVVSWLLSGVFSGELDVAWFLFLRPLFLCFLGFSAFAFWFASRRRDLSNAP
jgi:hypothetical protein